MPLTIDKIVDRLATEYKLERREALDLVETFLDDIKARVSKGERVTWAGCGSFALRTQKQRTRRDIAVDEDTPAWRIPSFAPSARLQALSRQATTPIEAQEGACAPK